MGVRRAVELVLDASNKYPGPIYTYGPLIHNPQVLSILEEKGISVLDAIPQRGSGTVLIRAHGVPPDVKKNLKSSGYTVIDATCPHVIKVQTIIRKHAQQGFTSIIIGDKDHPEVIGLLGYSEGKGFVIGNLKELNDLPKFEKAIIVVQTTQNSLFFEKVGKWAQKNAPHYNIFNTICDATEKRQVEVKQLATEVEAVIVVGGHNSGNTNRLAEIVRQAGKPVQHIETEDELEFSALASANRIGITAGASTPHWIIRKVYRALESSLYKRQQGLRRVFFNLQRTLLLTSIYVSIGAGSLCYACQKLQGIKSSLSSVLIAMLYVLSMHVFNNLIGGRADQYNDPDRALFYERHRISLGVLAVLAGFAGLLTAYTMGQIPFFILLAMSITGFSYNLRIIPNGLHRGQYVRIRDIPGSKTFLIAIAWGMVTAIVPVLAFTGTITIRAVVVFVWAVCMVFVRTAFFDILDMQGDRIVGRETIPILLGEDRTMRYLKVLLGLSLGVLVLSSIFLLVTTFGYILTTCSIFLYIVLMAHEKGHMLPGIGLEFLVDTHFVLSGFLTILWSIFWFGSI
jgi:4-hydroxy-3-methylbut-2-enyl diphosphate reductase